MSAGIATPRFLEFDICSDSSDHIVETIINEFTFPVVLKAACQGSSIGVSIIEEVEQLNKEICDFFNYGDSLLVEEFVKGIEVTVPILGNTEYEVLPIVEITSANKFYDYESKYTNGMCQHIIPARIDENTYKNVERIAVDAYRALNCKGLSRVDIIIDEKNIPYVIEVNTLPGMTEMSLFPDSARQAGIGFCELINRIVELAIDEKEKKQ